MKLARAGVVALGLLGLVSAACGAEAPRVAVMDFVLAQSPGSLDPATMDLSRAVQAKLLANERFAWVERQEFDRIQNEVDLAGLARVDAAAAVRLGHWLHADLLLQGQIALPAPGRAELTIEVIDLNRAELIATRKSPITVNRRNLVRPSPADAAAATAAALAALGDAVGFQEQNRTMRVIAPLCFRNTGPTGRLDFLEPRLTEAITAAATAAGGRRVLRFSRTSDAGEEAELVFAGLTDSDPDAWQRVADHFVWGRFFEGESEGVAFNDVPVTIAVQVWSGAGTPGEVRWDGPVRELDRGLQSVASRVMDLTKDRAAAGTRTEADRKRVAVELAAGNADSGGSSPSKNQILARRRLLQVACFFDPLNRVLQARRVQDNPMPESPSASDRLRHEWLRFAAFQSFARQFERNPDGSVAWEARLDTTNALETVCNLLASLPAANGQADASAIGPEERLRQFRSAVALWCREVAAANRPFAGGPLPPRLESFNKAWLDQLRSRFLHSDPIVARSAVEAVWPWLKPAAGRELRKDPKSELPARVFSVYDAFGDTARARALLDEAWQASAPAPADAARPMSAAPATPAQLEKPWLSARPPTAADSAPAVPLLDATVREVDPWPARCYSSFNRDQPLTKYRWARITSLAWHRGELWIGQALARPVGPDSRPFASENYLWHYDPALQTSELATARLGAHSAVRALVPHSDGLWLGLDSDGVWQWPAGQPDVRRFQGEDGLAIAGVSAGAAGRRSLYFLGGTLLKRIIAYYSLDSKGWFAVRVPFEPQLGGPPARKDRPDAVDIAACGDWIAVISPEPAFYNLAEKTWTRRLGAPAGPDRPARPFPPGSKPTLEQLRAALANVPKPESYSCLSADDSAFWLGSENAILQVDPRAPESKRLIHLPGTPVAAAQDGTRLWLVLETPNGPPSLALVDKPSGKCTGRLPLPVADLHLQVGDPNVDPALLSPAEMHWNRIAAADGRVWIGGPTLFEITLRGLAPPSDGANALAGHPLHRVAWRGDLAAVESALAAKADVNEESASGWTPLLAAVDGGHETIARALLRAGARPNQLARAGRSPLELASANGELDLVRLLLEAGARPDFHPAAVVRELPVIWRPVEPATPNLDATAVPAPPSDVRASLTDDGCVALSWADRSGNESAFLVMRAEGRTGQPHAIAVLPADSRSWLDEAPPRGGDAGYRVHSINGARPYAPRDESETGTTVWVNVPAMPPAGRIANSVPPKPLSPVVESGTPLMSAARHGHAEVVRALLAAKASPDLRDPVGQGALLLAARSGASEIARLLLAAGAQPDLPDASGRTAVQAVYERHEDEALWRAMFLALDPPRRSREASRLLQLAAADGQIHDLETLRELGGRVDAANESGVTALTLAITNRRYPTAAWLLQHGFSLDRRILGGGLDGITTPAPAALAAAVASGDRSPLAALLDAGIPVDRLIDGKPLLACAAEQGKGELVALLLERGANRSLKSREGKLPVDYATQDAVRALFAGQSLSTWQLATNIGIFFSESPMWVPPRTPPEASLAARLFAACKADDCDAIARVVAEGARMDSWSEAGPTPLGQALKSRAFRAARWLVENGAAVNLPSTKGNNPLSFAAGSGNLEIVNYLLDYGADPNGLAFRGYSPLMSACYADAPVIAARLLDAGADPNLVSWANNDRRVGPLAIALRKGNAQMVDLLLARGANPKAQGYAQFWTDRTFTMRADPSLLMYAAAGGNVDLIRRMIALGQDPHFASYEGYDALAWAADQGQLKAVEFLLPLVERSPHAMEMAAKNGHGQIVERLHRAGYQ